MTSRLERAVGGSAILLCLALGACGSGAPPDRAARIVSPSPLSVTDRTNIRTVAIAPLPASPEITMDNETWRPSTHRIVEKGVILGAISGAALMVAFGLQGGPEGLTLGLLLAPVGALAGGVLGGVAATSTPTPAAPVDIAAIKSTIGTVVATPEFRTCLSSETAAHLRARASKVVVAAHGPDSGSTPQGTVTDAELSIALDRAGWFSTDTTVNSVVLYFVGQARLVQAGSGRQIFSAALPLHTTQPRPLGVWACEPNLIRAELDVACKTFARHLADALFAGAGT